MSQYGDLAEFRWKKKRLAPGKLGRLYKIFKWRMRFLVGRVSFHPPLNDWNYILFKY